MAILKAENVIDQWQETLPAGGDQAEHYLTEVWRRAYDMQLPIEIGFEEASTGLLKQATGHSRKFLVMSPQIKTLNVFRFLHYATPMGNALTLGWFATDSNLKMGVSSGLRLPLIHDLDLFSNGDLFGLFSAIHEWAVLPAATALSESLQFGTTSISRKSKGGMFGVD